MWRIIDGFSFGRFDVRASTYGLHAGRVASGDRDHWRARRVAVARGPGGPRSITAHEVPEQSAAIWVGDAQRPRHQSEAAFRGHDQSGEGVVGIASLALFRAERYGSAVRYDGRFLPTAEHRTEYV